MKTELIMVGKTVDKLYTKGISDYQERIGHYMPFNITVIPALKNTKSLSEDQQKKAEGELILRLIQPSDTVVLLDEHGDGCMADTQAADSTPTGVHHRRSVRILSRRVQPCRREDFALAHDVLSPDGTPDLHRATLPRLHHHSRRKLPP